MFAKLKHAAIVSENYALLGKFYESVFQMRVAGRARPESAVAVGDGYVGLNINPRRAGRQAGLDHFGFEVEDVEQVFARFKQKYPSTRVLKRPGNRPFAGISTHDPAGNVFDLSQKGMENRTDVYEEGEWQQARAISHLALRAVEPERLAEFYADVFELRPTEKPAGDPNFYLSDGRVTLMIMPWQITDYDGSGIERPALDHLGFRVENLDRFRRELDDIAAKNHHLSPSPVGSGPEGKKRLELFKKCPLGKFHMADPDGVLIDVGD
ncbi:MAG TPA: VOC family protein [Candidatus Acidoferrales bacterium]|nr:VOC family protein [Candidatus Acidoferrales bacterium]